MYTNNIQRSYLFILTKQQFAWQPEQANPDLSAECAQFDII